MPTIAELQINVDSSNVDQGTKALNSFSQAAERASSSTDKKRASDENLANSSKKAATDIDAAARAAEKQNKEFEALLGKIDPITKKLNELARQEATLFANKDNLSTAAFDAYNQKIQDSVDKLIGLGSAQKQVAQDSDAIPDRLMKIAQAAHNNAAAQENLTTALRGASEAEQGLVSSGAVEAANRRAAAATEEYNAKRKLTGATNETAQAEKNQAASLDELLSKIDPALRKLNELDELQDRLNKQKALGTIDEDAFNRYSGVIDRNREALSRYSDGLMTTGKTAKETAFALRGLPAQFTDIVVSLQGGQAPLTVLLQQGGQIKDMFGGVVPAVKAVGGALLAMINPVSVTAVALATLAAATYSGSKELTAFNRAMIESAGFAGLSADGFTKIRDTLADTGLNAGKAAEALTLLAKGGQVTGDLFAKVAQSAILMEKATGQAMSKTIDDFNAIGKDPVAAAVRLDEQYKFLTASVLAQAAALERNGQESEAAELLQARLADQAIKTGQEMVDQAGYIERAWNGVKGAVTGTWDALKGLGREGDNSAAQLRSQQMLLERTRTRLREGNLLAGGMTDEEINKNPAVKYIQSQIDKYQELVNVSEDAAKKQAKQEESRQDAVAAQASALKRYETGLKGVEKAEETLRKVRLENQKIREGGETITANQSEIMAKNEARAIEELTKAKEKEGKVKASPLDTRAVTEVKNSLNEVTAEYEGYYKRVTALGQAGIVSAEATFNSQKAILEAQRKAVADSYDQQIAAINKLRDNKKNTSAQNINLDNQLTRAESARLVALEKIDAKQDALAAKEQGRIEKREQNIASYKSALETQIRNLEEEGARAADGVGRGSRQGRLASQLGANDRSFARQERDLAKSLGEGMDIEEYTRKLKDLKDAHSDMTAQIITNDKDIEKANYDWTNGFTAAVEDARDAGMNFAGSVNSALTGAFQSAGNALAEFVTTGKLNFRSFTLSVLSDMAKIAAQQAASGALSGILGIAASAASAYFGAGANGMAAGSAGAQSSALGASQAGYSSKYFQAQGGAWSGGTQMFAQGGMFTNSVVSNPTPFAMSNGAMGIMGEAGDEAIVPLARTRNGDLGVRMVGGGGGGNSTIVHVNVQVADGGSSSSSDGGSNWNQFGNELGSFVEQKVYTIINKETRSGGTLQPATGR